MQFTKININYKQPKIWRRPEIEKLPKKGVSYKEILEGEEDFKKTKDGAKSEIIENYTRAIDRSNDMGDLNRAVSDLSEFYGKAVLPTDELDGDFLLTKTNKNTLAKKLQPWCKNLVYNIPDVIDSTPYNDLVNQFIDVPAFVCLAGPSLQNNMHALKRIKGKAIIIAVDTSLRPLLEAGIVPDICVTHDANPNGCKFFLSKDHPLNVDNVNLNDQSDANIAQALLAMDADKERLDFKYDTLGLFVNYCHPLTLAAWNGREKRFYTVLDPGLPVYDMMAASTNYRKDPEKGLVPENKGKVIGGSSVGHVAEYIAIALGCNPISFLGLDLSYPKGKTYVDGASNQKSVKGQKLIDMPNLSGELVPTNLSMLSYKMVFEKSFPHILGQKPDLLFYNCTVDDKGNPAGILELGAEPKPIDWVIEEYCKKEVDLQWNKEKVKEDSLPSKT